MSYLFPRVAFAPMRCAAPVARHEISPLFSLFDDATRQLQQFERQVRRSQFNPSPQFNPRFDVKEDKESYILEGEVPGFKDNELSIEWNDNVLAIRGNHESVVESGKQPQPQAVDAHTEKTTAVEDAPASETGSVNSQKSHQPTVEDEEPATNASAVAATETQTATGQAPAETVAAPQQHQPQSQPEFQHWISERRSGQFLRKFGFPSNAVNHEAIKASLQSGILKVVVPKAPVPESRTITIE